MVIDMHTHIWPERIANRAVEKLKAVSGISAYTDGTIRGLKESMHRAGITLSVILPVVTNPEQFETVNKVAAGFKKEDGVISFGGIHPKNTGIEEKIAYIKGLGLKGIKIHPDYQETYFDDPAYCRIIDTALKSGLVVSTHAGVDVGLPSTVHCTPDRVLSLFDKLSLGDNVDNKLVLAHTGGCELWEEVYEKLAGKNIYMDISFSYHSISRELFLAIVKKHGACRLMFGTDSPWSDQKDMVQWVNELPITEEEKQQILHKTAEHLLAL